VLPTGAAVQVVSERQEAVGSAGSGSLPYLETIDVLRGIASLWVCWFHINTRGLVELNPILAATGAPGDVGVAMFFVISGFVIPYSLYRGKYKFSNFARFLAKRIVRLDPPYLAAIVLAIAVPYLTSRSSFHRGAIYHPNWIQVLAHLGYANAFIGFPWLVGGFWSLAIEFQYYVILALAFPALLVRKWSGLTGLYLVSGLAAILLPQRYMLPHYLPLFLIGISGFRYYVLRVSRWELAVCLAYSGLLTAYTEQTFYAVAAVLTCLCIVFVRYSNRPLQFLGAISYSLYVTHQTIYAIPIAQAVRFLGNRAIVRLVAPFVSLAFCLAVAWCLYKAVELPARKLSARFKYGAAKARTAAV